MRIKIAFVQLLPGIDLDENLDIGKKACVEAKEKGADIQSFFYLKDLNVKNGAKILNFNLKNGAI